MVGCEPEPLSVRAHGHLYPVFLIQLAISQIIIACTSFWGVHKSFQLWSQFFAIGTPSCSSIRQWVLRVGLYILQQPQPRPDWIWLVDVTIELGSAKCLVVLGIPQADWNQRVLSGRCCLHHHDVSVLAIEVLWNCNGSAIEQKLLNLAEGVGQPLQIVADHGSDLKKGIELYIHHNAGPSYTHDVTHAMALLLKHSLKNEDKFQSFLTQCHRTRQQLQQTQLSFLGPPTQRSKARYLNIGLLVEWAQGVLRYYQQGDFSRITPSHRWDQETLCLLIIHHQLEFPILQQLAALECKTYANQTRFSQQLMVVLSAEDFEQYGQVICQAADLGRRQFEEKLGWLLHQQPELQHYEQLLGLVRRANEQLKQQGLNRQSHLQFAQATQQLNLSERAQAFRTQVIDYIQQQASCLDDTHTWVASSDVLESLFGKYKLFSQRSPLKEVGRLILTLPLCTVQLTVPLVKQALETIQGIDVDNWAKHLLGISMFAQRKAVFTQQEKDTKIA